MKCNQCLRSYNNSDLKPQIIKPCNHTCCKKCINDSKAEKCPQCFHKIEKRTTNLTVLEEVNMHSLNDLKETVKKTNDLLTEVELTRNLFMLKSLKRKRDNDKLLRHTESELKRQSRKLIENILINQENLLKEIKNGLNEEFFDVFLDEKELISKIDLIKASLNRFESKQSELNRMEVDLKEIKTNFEAKIKQLESVQCYLEYISSDSIDLGEILLYVTRIRNEPQNSEMRKSMTDEKEESKKRSKTDDIEMAKSYLNEAKTLEGLKKYNEALVYYNRALVLNPNDALAYNNKGFLLLMLKRYKDALVCYNKALDLHLNYEFVHANKGFILLKLKNYEQALTSLDAALELDRKNVSVYSNKAFVLTKMNKLKRAIKCYEAILKLEPDNKAAIDHKSNLELLIKQKL